MRPLPPFLTALFVLFGLGCASTPFGPGASAVAPAAAPRQGPSWASFSLETFARAKAEHKLIVLDGTAAWCRPCRAMEATTYRDPVVQKLLDEHFIAIKVDIDENPDVEKLYADWGWPATVLFSPDATELGKYQGYLDPEEFAGILSRVVAAHARDSSPDSAPADAGLLPAVLNLAASATSCRAPADAAPSGGATSAGRPSP
ncbi:MAG TPA: DUF255 domain-containing protein [Polyangiaceae bacterium]|nr:DUF255 domain-containing protein [Polyangiaceae bacterium]